MKKPISQREARSTARALRIVQDECTAARSNLAKAEAHASALDAKNTQLAGMVAQLERQLATGTRLGKKVRIATWQGAPVGVREAVRVASHLGRTVTIEVEGAKKAEPSYLNHYVTIEPHEQAPPPVDEMHVYAYETL